MQVIVITGGSRGIGAAAARACAARGMGIILTYNSQREAAEAVVAEVEARGVRGVALPLDVSDTASFCAFRVAVADSLREVWNGIALRGHILEGPVSRQVICRRQCRVVIE